MQLAALALVAFYLPALVIYLGLIPFSRRFVVPGVAGASAVVGRRRGTAARDLGLRTHSLRPPRAQSEAPTQLLPMHPAALIGARPARVLDRCESCE